MPGFLPKEKRNLRVVGIVVFLLIYTVILIVISSEEETPQQQQQQAMKATYVAEEVKVSEESTVQEKVVAAKLDLERKIVAPKTPRDLARIRTIIEREGGKIIESKGSVVVADIPKDVEETVTKELEEANSISGVEVDYPVFLGADSPDWGVTRIAAPDVWETTSGSGIRVAVIDTGIDYTHPELRGRYAGGFDAVNNDTDPRDDHGHGTHVAGTVAAEMNGGGLAGVSPGVALLAGKALGSDGSGYTSDLIEAIDWAMQNGAQVINYSLGSSYNSKALEDKINQAASRGIIQVAAAGNNGGGSLLYPAAYGTVISVAATDSSDRLAGFSALGAEISAPGVGITSAVPGGGYATWSGTSMAAPHVTATVALMLANKQTDIRQQLQKTAIDLGPAGRDSYYGYGLVHAKPAALGEDTLAPVITFLSPENGSYVKDAVTVGLAIQDEYIVTNTQLYINNQLVREWTQAPYSYSWNTNALPDGEYTLLVKAADENENIGEAQVTVIVSDVMPTPTRIISVKQQGQSAAVRQDTQNEHAAAHRQDQNTPASGNKAESGGGQSQAPETSNANERNQKAEEHSQAQNENKGNGKKDVQGATTVPLWQQLKDRLFRLFQ